MSKLKYTRVQGIEWFSVKDELEMIDYRINKKGHIKGFYKDEDGHLYSHWMNDEEEKEFLEKMSMVIPKPVKIKPYPIRFGNNLLVKGPDGNLGMVFSPRGCTIKEKTEKSTVDKINDLRDYIDTKIQKSMEYDWGLSDKRGDRLMTETVIELQLIIEKLDEILKSKGEKDGK